MSKRRTTVVWMPWWMWGIAGVFIFMWKMIVLPFKVLGWILTPDQATKAAVRAVVQSRARARTRQAPPAPVAKHRASHGSNLAKAWHRAMDVNPAPAQRPVHDGDTLEDIFPARGRW